MPPDERTLMALLTSEWFFLFVTAQRLMHVKQPRHLFISTDFSIFAITTSRHNVETWRNQRHALLRCRPDENVKLLFLYTYYIQYDEALQYMKEEEKTVHSPHNAL